MQTVDRCHRPCARLVVFVWWFPLWSFYARSLSFASVYIVINNKALLAIQTCTVALRCSVEQECKQELAALR